MEAVKLLQSAVAMVAIFIAYKYLSRLISRTGKNAELEPHAMNAAKLIFRVAAIMVASTVARAHFIKVYNESDSFDY